MSSSIRFTLLFLFGVVGLNSFAQDLYDVSHIPGIKIYFVEDNWDELLDAFHVAGQEERLECSVEIDGTMLEGCGIRYKGFSSVSVDYVKNPFNIKLDYVTPGQSYQGKDKIKLSNVIQDPSFVREVLSYEIARKYMPASQANFARVFINDVFWGLYTNVESVDKQFLDDHFNTTANALFKCNPDELDLFGENSNLSNTPGTEESDYYELYDMKSDEGWSDLVELIDVLNEDPDNIEPLLNIDRALWMHAFNYALVNFDSYVGYAQNYYLYKDMNGQFNSIIWDLNMSFASYRLSDASEFWDGFGIEEAKVIDPLLHYSSVSVFPRPLMRKLFENDTYRRMYLAHLRTIMEENFLSGDYMVRAEFFHDLIDPDVLADENKFYSYQDFLDNINSTVTDLVDYPGISDLMDARSNFLLEYPGIENPPVIEDVMWSDDITLDGSFEITVDMEAAADVTLAYRYGGTGLFSYAQMLDDGQGADVQADDMIYTFELTNTGNAIQFYVYADDGNAGAFEPQRAAYEYFSVESQVEPQDLVINEFMAFNTMTVTDENGDYDDWIELYNNTDNHLSTAGMYLSDDELNPVKWAMPNIMMEPNDFLIIWADEQGSQGSLHANFQLSYLGEFISLAYGDSTIIDSVSFDEVAEDQSIARFPNGTGPFVEMNTTFADFNNMVSVENITEPLFEVFPNPTNDLVYITHPDAGPALLKVHSIDGREIEKIQVNQTLNRINVDSYSAGVYLLTIEQNNSVSSQKLIVHKAY